MLYALLTFIISTFFLVKSADFFVEASEKVGRYFRLPYFFIGVVLIGIGTSLPEFVTSIISVFKGEVSIPVANVLGSNVANLLFIVGFSALITPLIIKKKLIKIEIPFLFLSSFLPFLFLINGKITRIEGIFLLISLIFYIYYLLRQKREKYEPFEGNVIKEFFVLLVSLVVLVISSNYVVSSLIELSKELNIMIDVLASILLALGTSLPELMVSISILKNKKDHDMILGNILGSNIINVFLILGVSSLIKPLVTTKLMVFASTFLIFITLLFIFTILDNRIEREEGLILLVLYFFFVIYLFDPSLF